MFSLLCLKPLDLGPVQRQRRGIDRQFSLQDCSPSPKTWFVYKQKVSIHQWHWEGQERREKGEIRQASNKVKTGELEEQVAN